MPRFGISAVVMFGAVASAVADDRPAPPKKGSALPVVLAASARVEASGKIVVRFSLPGEVPDGIDYVAGPDRAPVIGARSKIGWYDVDVVADGKTVRAFTADGKLIEPSALPKRLAKSSRVVMFHGAADPDPYYLGLFRSDVVLFVAPLEKFQVP